MSNALASFTVAAATPIALDGDETKHFAVTTAAANLWTSSGSDDWLGRPVLADDGARWIAAYRAATSHYNTGGGKVHVRFSTDEGATWTNEDTWTDGSAVTGAPFGPHAADSNDNVGGAVIVVAPNGDILLFTGETGTTGGAYKYRSTDGGATWADEGQLYAATNIKSDDAFVYGSTIYISTLEAADKDGGWPVACALYASTDNGATITKLSDLPTNTYGNEFSTITLDGTNFVAVKREGDGVGTWISRSADGGLTWTDWAIIDEGMYVVQKPVLRPLAGGIMMVGRQGRMTVDALYTVVWYSPDSVRWGRKFFPDTTGFTDGAYCSVLERSDGKFYILTYGGTTAAAAIRSGVFEIA